MTLIAVSGAPIEKLVAYRERMGWCFNWASSYEWDFNADLGFSSSLEQTRKAIEPMLSDLPPVAFRNASKAGTDIYGYLTELFGFTAFALEDGTVHQTYSTTATARHSVMDSPCLPTRSSGAHSHGWVEATKFCSDTEGSEDQAWAWYRRASKTLVSNFFR